MGVVGTAPGVDVACTRAGIVIRGARSTGPEHTLADVGEPTRLAPATAQRLLVIAARQGDADAFDALVERWIDRLYALAYRILRNADAADDATQDALVTAWRDIRGLREPERFDAWIHRLLVRVCYRHAAKRRRESVRLVDVDTVDVARRDDADALADRDRIERAFRRLTVEQRTVLALYHYLGRSHAEIGDLLLLPEGTVASRLHYAVKALRAAVEADDRPGAYAP